MSASRRAFLAQMSASAAAAAGMWAANPLPKHLWSRPAGDLVAPPDDALLESFALAAIDAARAAGASFADVRVAGGRIQQANGGVWATAAPPEMGVMVTARSEYGVRAIVDGQWGFATGQALTKEAVVDAARRAVARARGAKRSGDRRIELAPVPRVERGQWSSPVEKDPFTVPLREQADLMVAALDACQRVKRAGLTISGVKWSQHTRVFASTEGSLTIQRFMLAEPVAYVRPDGEGGWFGEGEELPVPVGQYGYEAITMKDFVKEQRTAMERVVARMTQNPPYLGVVPTEVGRYDIVFASKALTRILRDTVGDALDLERVLGYNANAAGTSFLAPPSAILGNYKLGSPLVTVTADRTQPHSPATCAWDDEGTSTGAHTLVDKGVVVDYLTSRETSPEIASWQKTRAGGGARGHASGVGGAPPRVRTPNLTLTPDPRGPSVEEIIADTKRGYYIKDIVGGDTDQQVLSGQYVVRSGDVREIRNGKLGPQTTDLGIQFVTPQFWKSVNAVGNAKTEDLPQRYFVTTAYQGSLDVPFWFGQEIQLQNSWVRSPVVRVKDVNVWNSGRTA